MQRTQIENLLPGVFRRTLQDGQPLAALLHVMEDLHAPAEELLAELPTLINPYSTPERYLPMLAHWVNLEGIFPPRPPGDNTSPWAPRRLPMPAGRLRALIATAAKLARWRGTARGLKEFLQTATGADGFVIHENTEDDRGAPIAFHLRVVAPTEVRFQRALIERIVEIEKPAYVTWQLEFEGHAQPIN